MHYTEIEMAESMITPKKKSSLKAMWWFSRVSLCFEYSARPAYLNICVRKVIKAVVSDRIKISEDDTADDTR